MFKRFLLIALFTLGIGFLFSSKIYAVVDITLEDNPNDNAIEVRINSNNDMLSGVAMNIFFSNDLVVKEINKANDFCTMGFDSVASNGVISIECLNDEMSVFNDTLATITYSTDELDYFFYIDENTLDIGSNELGKINNINKPENVNTETEENGSAIEEPNNNDIVVKIVDFVKEYYTYISLAVIIIVTVLLISLFKRP